VTLDYLCCWIPSIGIGREINLVKKSNTLRDLVIKFRVIRLEDGFAVKLDLQTIFELRQLQKLRILSKEEREQERLHLHRLSEQDPDSHLILRLGKAKIVASMQDTFRKGSVRTTDFHLHFFAEQRIRSRNHLHLDELIDVLGFRCVNTHAAVVETCNVKNVVGQVIAITKKSISLILAKRAAR